MSLGEDCDKRFYRNIFRSRSIIFDMFALCFINVYDCLHVGFFPTILHE